MALVALTSANANLRRNLENANAARTESEARLAAAEEYLGKQRIVWHTLVVVNADTIHGARADVVECKRAIQNAKRAVEEAELALAQGTIKAELAAVREAHPLRGLKSEAWRKRAEAVENVQKAAVRRLHALCFKLYREQCGSALHKRVIELEFAAEQEARWGAEKERTALRLALESERRKVQNKKLASTVKLMVTLPVELCKLILGYLNPRSRAAFACANRTFRDAVVAFEVSVPRHASIAAAKAEHDRTPKAKAKKAEQERRKRMGWGDFVAY